MVVAGSHGTLNSNRHRILLDEISDEISAKSTQKLTYPKKNYIDDVYTAVHEAKHKIRRKRDSILLPNILYLQCKRTFWVNIFLTIFWVNIFLTIFWVNIF